MSFNILALVQSFWYKYRLADGREISYQQIIKDEKIFHRISSEFYNKQAYISSFLSSFDNHYDMFLCGDSVINAIDPTEKDKETLGYKIARSCNAKVLSFNCGAFSPILYKDIFPLIPKANKKKIFLIEFNLRSLSDEWYLRPAYQFEKLRCACLPLRSKNFVFSSFVEKFCLAFFFYIAYSDAMLKKTTCYVDEVLKNSSLSYRKDLLCRNSFHYCFPDAFVKERIGKLLSCVKILKKKNYIPYIFITPINRDMIHEKEIPFMLNNIHEVMECCLSSKAMIRDFSMLVNSTEFTDAEHLKSSGRDKLVHELKNG